MEGCRDIQYTKTSIIHSPTQVFLLRDLASENGRMSREEGKIESSSDTG